MALSARQVLAIIGREMILCSVQPMIPILRSIARDPWHILVISSVTAHHSRSVVMAMAPFTFKNTLKRWASIVYDPGHGQVWQAID